MHINSFNRLVEVIDRNGKRMESGEVGEIVVTDLTNIGMPFIRYRIEDLAAMSDVKCSCGRNLPLIKKVYGRESDFIVRPDGVMVSGISLSDNFGANITGVKQVQIIQEKIDQVKIRIVIDGGLNISTYENIKRLSREFFGHEMKITIEEVEEIPFEASGKIRFVICKLNIRDYIER
jgi:phenylacetate-CoA ligase